MTDTLAAQIEVLAAIIDSSAWDEDALYKGDSREEAQNDAADKAEAIIQLLGPPGMKEAVVGISDDFMTSEHHHPGYVLIPAARFDFLREAETRAMNFGKIDAQPDIFGDDSDD